MSARPSGVALAGLLLAASFLLYAATLKAQFVADDWGFLQLVATHPSRGVLFEPLVERYFRPLVVLLYRTNYQLFGLWPVPYHATVIALHGMAATLFGLFVTALTRNRTTGLLTGLLFVAFAGHSEAVAWVGGVADVLLAVLLFGGALCLVRGLEQKRRAAVWLWTAALLLSSGVLAKETGVIAPVLGACTCVAIACRRSDRTFPWKRAAATLVLPAATIGIYLLFRARLFGNPVGAYTDLAASAGTMFGGTRALLLRVFLPAYSRLALAWAHGHDIALLMGAATAIAWLAWRTPEHRRLLFFSLTGIAVSLAPALPLAISLNTTETERVVYIPTAFGALLTVLMVQSLIASRAVRLLILAGLIGVHGVVLQRFNRNWVDAGRLLDSTMHSFVSTVRAHDPGIDGHVFVLSLPDNVRGAYVFRRGFYEALHFLAPDLEARHASIIGIDSQTLWRADEPVVVSSPAPSVFTLDVAPNRFLQTSPPSRPFFEFIEWTPQSYRLRFTTAVERGIVLKVSEMQTTLVGEIHRPGRPSGGETR